MTVRQVLLRKGGEVYAISPEATVLEALKALAQHDIGALLVMEGERLLGIFSERDYARKLVLLGRFSKDTRVAEVMTPDPLTLPPEADLAQAMRLMTEHRVRHLPVVEGGRVVGVISIGDVVKAIIGEQEVLIGELSRYVTENR
ncbi:MAG: CBS domain-containing protein [Thermus sp.]|uniref:CBS domain-containing protein n=1 Tax=unclassified Thermus TaxID=2619321 RepID=UPI000238925F|nr:MULTISPECIES: CBS domain-containing protein [unclassified Thermus]AEV17113.1 CBS domain protein [Thermus sp. CCB_US3_UF1]MCS6867592.1 CBS domain-containing protein [Thermus sp.]MCS7217756.1 CBS domain-containing protein [Thermus sp.]MCX7849544.1 CBS domain-containing protein [Thermus sp.]MDW8016572.1 CBS domain-containing protein [Thermus sp.]